MVVKFVFDFFDDATSKQPLREEASTAFKHLDEQLSTTIVDEAYRG